MNLENIIIETIVPFLGNYFLILSVIASAISGNIFVLFLATLSGQKIFSFFLVLFVSITGVIISDIFWFNIGKTKMVNDLLRRPHFLFNYYHFKKTLEKTTDKNLFMVFLTSKLLVGTKILTLMYTGRKKIRIEDFIKYNLSSTIIWVMLLNIIGWLVGRGFAKVASTFDNLKLALIITIVIIIIIYILWVLMSKILINKFIDYKNKIILYP